MSDEAVEEFLEHFGVKGMRWGVRKDKKERSTGQKIKRGAAFAAGTLLVAGTASVVVTRNRNLAKTAAEQQAIKDIFSRSFVARDAKGNVIKVIGANVTSETIRNLP